MKKKNGGDERHWRKNKEVCGRNDKGKVINDHSIGIFMSIYFLLDFTFVELLVQIIDSQQKTLGRKTILLVKVRC